MRFESRELRIEGGSFWSLRGAEGWPPTDVDRRRPRFRVHLSIDGLVAEQHASEVDSNRRDQYRSRIEIGGRKTDGAPSHITEDHLAAQ